MELIDTVVGRGENSQTVKGVKMKIGFNGHWKESMTELSGGQRSLLALSYLLAMLKFRAAPFYILDEIDSAMDLSHTENVGYIISKFFPQSQFIVISLKGGLFNAANIIFRTSLNDGKSQIQRYEGNNKDKKKRGNMMDQERNSSGARNRLDRLNNS